MPLASIVPSVAFPPNTPSPPTGPTYQRIVVVVPPVSVAVKVTLLAVPEVAGVTQAGGVGEAEVLVQGGVLGELEPGELIVTTGAAVMVTVDVAKTFGSSYETAVTLTVWSGLRVGTTGGAWYSPFESIRPTVSSPPV